MKSIVLCENLQFETICREWLLSKEIKLKKSSYIKYSTLIEKYLIPNFGVVCSDEFSCFLFESKLSQIMLNREGKPLSKSTMNTMLYIVRSVLKFGARRGYNSNVQVEFECPDMQKSCTVLTAAEEHILLNYLLCNTRNSNHLGIMLSLMTGMRIGEICALTREAINKEERLITICQTAQRTKTNSRTKLIVTTPKSRNSHRTIPIPEIVFEYMTNSGIWELNEQDYVLSQKDVPYEPRTLQYAYQKVLAHCNIKYKNFHSLRHTFATNCVDLGFDIKTLSELLGHSSVNFTLNRYVHSSISTKQKQMKLLDQKYEEISSNS